MAYGYPSFSGAATDFGNAVGDFFTAAGDRAAASSYTQAATIEKNNAQLEVMSTAIKTAATQRQIYKVIGGQQADVAGAGLASSGSAVDIMRDSAQQGALQKGLIGIQGTINENAYLAQATAYTGEASAASAAAKAADAAGTGAAIGGVFSLFGV